MRRNVERVIGTAIAQAGPEGVLEVLPLELDAREGVSQESRTWLIVLLKAHVSSASLMFYGGRLLAMGNALFEGAKVISVTHSKLVDRTLHSLSLNRTHQVARSEGLDIKGRNMDIVAQQLWELLPAFCRKPTDLPTAFPQMAKVLGAKISGETQELCGVVCNSLIMLINQNKSEAKGNREAQGNIQALASYARNFMPLLFNAYTECQDSQATMAVVSRCIEVRSSSTSYTHLFGIT